MGVPCRFEHSTDTGWLFVTPWPLNAKAFQNACAKALQFWTQLHKDFSERGRPDDADVAARALEDLKRNRIRNVVDSTMIHEFKLTGQEERVISLPGTR